MHSVLSTQPVTDSILIHSASHRQHSYPLSQSPTAFLSSQPVTDSIPIHSASHRQHSYPLSQSPTAFLSTQPVTYPLSQSRVYSASHLSSQPVTEYTAFYPLSQSLNIQRYIHSARHRQCSYPLSQSLVYSTSHLSSQPVTEYASSYPLSQSPTHSASH